MTVPDCCAERLVAARAADGEQVTVTTTPPTGYVAGAKCWRCPHGVRFYTLPVPDPQPEGTTP